MKNATEKTLELVTQAMQKAQTASLVCEDPTIREELQDLTKQLYIQMQQLELIYLGAC